MKPDGLRKVIDNPALSPEDRYALESMGSTDESAVESFDGPTLSAFIPAPEQSAYYRTREWLAAIPVCGRIAKILTKWHARTLADLEEPTVRYLNDPKLTAIWNAAEAVRRAEHRIDSARSFSEAYTRLVMNSDLTGKDLAALIMGNLERARAEYRELAA